MGIGEGPRLGSLDALVDLEGGAISREIFVSEDLYQREQEQIFARCWLFVGHESQVPNPGDYFVSCMGEEGVIVVRDHHRQLHVFLNTCRHRGMKVCRYDEGNTTLFTCPYHGWSYGTDGRLAGVPYFEEAYRSRLDKSRWGLISVAQIENYHGTIWATWDPDAPPFLDYLGEMRHYLDLVVDQANGEPGGMELIGGVQKWTMACNWKFAAENFVGDAYHAVSHRSADLAGFAPSGTGRHIGDVDKGSLRSMRLALSFPRLGHGGNCSIELRDDAPYPGGRFPGNALCEEYFRQAYEQRRRRLGRMARLVGGAGTIFPNMSFSSGDGRIVVWHPRGPMRTEAWRFYLVDRAAPQEVKDLLLHYNMRYAGPGGMTEQDDMENWNYATAASRGIIARRYPYNYEIGLEDERPAGDPLPWSPEGALVSSVPSEQNQRGLYRRWLELMEATSWNGLPPKKQS